MMFQDDLPMSQITDFLSSSNMFGMSLMTNLPERASNSGNLHSELISSSTGPNKQPEQIEENIVSSSDGSSQEKPISNFKRKLFTELEDHYLTIAALKYNQKSWKKIAQCVPNRTPKQCRDRWMNYLKPSLKFDPWTEKDDELLVSLVNSYGTHWTKMIEHFPNRSTNSLKNRWYWLIKNEVKSVSIDKSMSNGNGFPSQLTSIDLSQQNLDNNILLGLNQKNDFRFNANDVISVSNNSPFQKDQPKEYQNYFYLPKNKNKIKKYSRSDKKQKKCDKKRKNTKNINVNENSKPIKNEMQQNGSNLDDDDLLGINFDDFNF